MRIIDADRLKEKMSVTLEVLKFIFPPGEQRAHLEAAFSTLGDMVDKCPTIDAVPVVFCKDCKWWIPHGKETTASIPASGECRFKDKKFRTSCWEFCYWGERKDDV